ncbi:hypothetical protein JX265_014027 [Neoarthrinium moseri]|uniref:Uncharacterized protein n=1 Tax=Neoarthrinium moseri TaxID=1658444 RepID=A0A9Q0AH48_9PEZI|nr:hypothetical protein JX265_014027 [Neoarthrinium moseri]
MRSFMSRLWEHISPKPRFHVYVNYSFHAKDIGSDVKGLLEQIENTALENLGYMLHPFDLLQLSKEFKEDAEGDVSRAEFQEIIDRLESLHHPTQDESTKWAEEVKPFQVSSDPTKWLKEVPDSGQA